MLIVDSHLHLTKAPLLGRKGDARSLRAELRGAGVSQALVLAEGEYSDLFYDTKELIEVLRSYPDLHAVGSLSLHTPVAPQLALLKRAHREGVLAGIKLYPGYQYFYPGDKRLEPVYRFAALGRLPVIIHCGDLLLEGAARPPLLKYSHPIHVDEAAALHTNVTFIIAHAGNPWMADAAEVIYKNKNVYADLSGLYIHSIEREEGQDLTRRLNEMIHFLGGASRLLFGTDWPLLGHKEAIEFFTKHIPRRDRKAFFAETALSLFERLRG